MMDEVFRLGYVMGLLVCEGHLTGHGSDSCLSVELEYPDGEPLIRLLEEFGGKVWLNRRRWTLRGPMLRDAVPVLEFNLPESAFKEEFRRWLAEEVTSRVSR